MMESPKFLEFWSVYPRKQAKPTAWASWQKHDCEEIAESIIAHVKIRALRDKQWKDGFTPMPATFLNQHRWEDDYKTIEEPRPPPSTSETAVEPPPVSDPWIAALNIRLLKHLVDTKASCDVDKLRELVREKRRIAAQMSAAKPSLEEWQAMVPGIMQRFREL